MNILYCGDKNIIHGVVISALSVAKNVNEPLSVYIMTIGCSINSKDYYAVESDFGEYLTNVLKGYNSKSQVRVIDITEMFHKEIPFANLDTRFTPGCMVRLFADSVAQLPRKVLYLDNDVICRKDFSLMYHSDMGDNEIAGVLDYYGKWFFKRKIIRFDYLNSGVLMLNLDRIRKTDLFARCRRMCIEKKMFMPDQSAINKLATSKRILPRRYNEQRRLKSDTVFQHFTTSFRFFPYIHTITVKPWQKDKLHSVLGIYEYDDLLDYASASVRNYLKDKES